MLQLILHLWGDYILQSSWLALNKSKRALPCALHCLTYTLPFLFVTRCSSALFVIYATHYLLDRYGLARYVIWLKEWQTPKGHYPFSWCSMTGYLDEEKARPVLDMAKLDGESDTCEQLRELMAWLSDGLDDQTVNRPIWIRVWLTIVADNTLHLTFNYLALRFLTPTFEHWLWGFCHAVFNKLYQPGH